MADLTNRVFGRLTALQLYSQKDKNTRRKWLCSCSCGNTKVASEADLVVGDTKSCGCIRKEMAFNHNWTKHGLSKTPEYLSWKLVKRRCFCKESQDYKDYGAVGITMDESFIDDFPAFLAEIGKKPDNKRKWSVDRIDNTKGYLKGNIRWALDTEQARNKGMYKNNKSGVTGVYLSDSGATLLYVCTWYETTDGKLKSRGKSFSVNKYGLLPAFAKACQYREDKIKELNTLGYGYTDNHGK